LGFVAGVAGVLAYQSLRRQVGEESAEGLLKDLGEKVRALELRAPDLGAAARKSARILSGD
jgi:hypothetical protein